MGQNSIWITICNKFAPWAPMLSMLLAMTSPLAATSSMPADDIRYGTIIMKTMTNLPKNVWTVICMVNLLHDRPFLLCWLQWRRLLLRRLPCRRLIAGMGRLLWRQWHICQKKCLNCHVWSICSMIGRSCSADCNDVASCYIVFHAGGWWKLWDNSYEDNAKKRVWNAFQQYMPRTTI